MTEKLTAKERAKRIQRIVARHKRDSFTLLVLTESKTWREAWEAAYRVASAPDYEDFPGASK